MNCELKITKHVKNYPTKKVAEKIKEMLIILKK